MSGPANQGARRAVALAITMMGAFAVGCGTPCEEAAQICADHGRSSAPTDDADPADCAGPVEARAECIAEAESCAPDVVEACAKAAGGDEDDAEGP